MRYIAKTITDYLGLNINLKGKVITKSGALAAHRDINVQTQATLNKDKGEIHDKS